jgi:hypothetical protein
VLFKFVMNFVFGESLFKSLSAPKAYVMIDCNVYVFFFFAWSTEIFIFLFPIFIFCFATQYKRKTMPFITIFMCFCFLAKSKLRQINGTTAGSAETEYYNRNFAQSAKMEWNCLCKSILIFMHNIFLKYSHKESMKS